MTTSSLPTFEEKRGTFPLKSKTAQNRYTKNNDELPYMQSRMGSNRFQQSMERTYRTNQPVLSQSSTAIRPSTSFISQGRSQRSKPS